MRIEIERDGNRVGLRLPCTEENMQAAELAVGITNPTDTCVTLAEMDKRFPTLQPLVGRVHNLDHLNLLARMIDGLFGAEYDQFQAAISLTGATELRDIINLTQNVTTEADLTQLNVLAKQMEKFKSGDIRKLAAMWEYALHTVSTDPIPGMIALAQHMDDFMFAPGITDDEQLGVYLIQKSGLYAYDSRLEEYYCYWNLGSDAFDRQQGLYIEDGYIGLCSEIQFGEIFDLHELSELEAVL